MHDIDALVRDRRSVRTFEENPVSQQDLEKLFSFLTGLWLCMRVIFSSWMRL